LAIDAPVWLDLDLEVVVDDLNITAHATANQNISGNYVIHLVLVNRYEYLPNSPNGQPHHYASMLKMAPSAYGQVFTASSGDTTQYTATITLDPSWELQNLDLVCFVQNNTTHEVIQSTQEAIPLDFPNILIEEYQLADPTGNNDGRVDPGETGEMVVTLQNQVPFHDATDVVATLSTVDPLINVTNATVAYPDLVSGASASNSTDPFEFYVDPAFEAHEVTFELYITAEPGGFEATYPVTFMVGRPDILLVNDDFIGAHQSWYEDALAEFDHVYDVWVQTVAGALPQDEMDRYLIVIWYTGDDQIAPLSSDEQTKIENFLMGGGRLFLSSQYLGNLIGGSPFHEEILHAVHLEDTVVEFMLDGVAGDPVSDGTSLSLVGSSGAGNATSNSSFDPLAPAVGIYTYAQAGTFGALRCEDFETRFIYFGLPFEAVSGMVSTTPRAEVLNNCLTWLAEPLGVRPSLPSAELPTSLELAGIYPNPFNPTTEIQITLPISEHATLKAFDTQGRLVQTLLSGTYTAGRYNVTWDAASLPSGIYMLTLQQGHNRISQKAVLLK
jgi:hypothetical protein